MHQIIPWQERVDGDLYNHGKEGLKTQFDKFVAAHAKEEEVRNDQHRQNRARINLLIGLVALLCTMIMTILAVKGLQKTSSLFTGHMPSTYATK